MNYQIRPGQLDEVVYVQASVPELNKPYGKAEYERRLAQVPHLILIALAEGQPVGFKVGYERDSDGSFYSWMGGVSSLHRRRGIAQLLADEMEHWCRQRGYVSLRFKTRNRHKAMLLFGLHNGFRIIGFEAQADADEHRIWLEKKLPPLQIPPI